jgi:hypothetical protein
MSRKPISLFQLMTVSKTRGQYHGICAQRPSQLLAKPMSIRKTKSNRSGGKRREGAVEYKPEFCDQALKLCDYGATNADLADHFGVTISVISTWQSQHPEFAEACRLGKSRVDARVQQAFYNQAVGYSRVVEKVRQHKGELVLVRHTEQVPSHSSTAKTWLYNRCGTDWNDEPKQDDEDPVTKLLRELNCQALRPRELTPPSANEGGEEDE